jgi:ribosome-associated protein
METQPDPTIRLDQFLKLVAAVGTGGEAKVLIQSGEIQVNGLIETRRRRKLSAGDVVQMDDMTFTVELEDDQQTEA